MSKCCPALTSLLGGETDALAERISRDSCLRGRGESAVRALALHRPTLHGKPRPTTMPLRAMPTEPPRKGVLRMHWPIANGTKDPNYCQELESDATARVVSWTTTGGTSEQHGSPLFGRSSATRFPMALQVAPVRLTKHPLPLRCRQKVNAFISRSPHS